MYGLLCYLENTGIKTIIPILHNWGHKEFHIGESKGRIQKKYWLSFGLKKGTEFDEEI